MSRTVPVYVADVDTELLTYTELRLYIDTSPDGDFSTLAATETLEAGVSTYYPIAAAAGPDTWFAWRLYNTTGPVSGDLSSPFQLQGVTLAQLRLMAAQQAAAGFGSVCTATGSTTSLVDEVLRDQGLSETFMNSSWVDRYPIVTADRIRRMAVNGFDPDTGAVTPLRDWTVAPVEDEPYAIYGLIPPIDQAGVTYSWNQAVRQGLEFCWYNDEVILVDQDVANDDRSNQIVLDQVPWLREDRIRAIWAQQVDENGKLWRTNLTKQGSFWDIRDLGFGHRVLVLPWWPQEGWSVIAAVVRQPDLPYKDEDLIPIDTNLAMYATAYAAYRYLNKQPQTKGQYKEEELRTQRDWYTAYVPFRPKDAMINA